MKMKNHLFAMMAFSAGLGCFAQSGSNGGGISADMLADIVASYKDTPADKAVMNALCANGIGKLAMNHENLAFVDTHFSNVVESKGITDQKSSGRCWMFTGMNVMRAKMISKYNLGAFEFSQAYTFFWDQLEKANLFLQGIIDTSDKEWEDQTVQWLLRNPLNDGGQFTGVSDIIGKYGIVPKDVMQESYSSDNTSQMAEFIKRKLREGAMDIRNAVEANGGRKDAARLEAIKKDVLCDVYRILVLNIGEPPSKFVWTMRDADGKEISTKEYTPKSFYDEYIGEDLRGNYVMVMNDPSREYYKCYEIDYDRHMYDGYNWLYVNLPIDDVKDMAIASIKDSTMLYFSCDVGKFLNMSKGTLDLNNFDYESLLGMKFGMDKKERVMSFDSGSSHAMTLMAVDLDENGKSKKWMVENSWGENAGYRGHLIMTDQWFEEYMFRLVVEKKYVPEKILDILKQKPERLPAWDPMFKNED